MYQINNLTQEELISKETGIPLDDVKNTLLTNGNFSRSHFEHMQKKHGKRIELFRNFIGEPFRDVYTQNVCGQLKIKTDKGTKAATVSFVSFLSGLVLISEIIKHFSTSLINFPMNNHLDFLRFNLFLPDRSHIVKRIKNPDCPFCAKTTIQNYFCEKWAMAN